MADKEVDVIIIPKARRLRKTLKAKEFVEKWAGFLHPLESSDSKFDYLMEKYKWKEIAIKFISNLIEIVDVIGVDKGIIINVLKSNLKDMV